MKFQSSIPYIEYMPTGEQFSEQRDCWSTPYKFNSKELDAETGLYYYGARYYTPEIGIWLSACPPKRTRRRMDPLSDKYPSLSPFAYCALNPVILVDPDGREVEIGGEAKKAFFKEVKKGASELGISVKMNKNGVLKAKHNGKGDISKDGQMFLDAVNSQTEKIKINATNSDYVNGNEPFVGGAFMGNEITSYSLGGDGVIYPATINAYQTVNPNDLKIMDDYYGKPGQTSIHEITEPYQGALISIGRGASSGYANALGSVYKQAHFSATPPSIDMVDQYTFDKHGTQTRFSNNTPASRGYYFKGTNVPIKQVNYK